MNTERCPMVPARFRRAKCWRRCVHWDKRRRVCRIEVQERIEAAVEGRHPDRD